MSWGRQRRSALSSHLNLWIPRKHEQRGHNLGVRTFLGPEEATFLHDPWRNRNVTTQITVGSEEVIKKFPQRLYLIEAADDDKTHQVPPFEQGQLGGNDGEMLEKGRDPSLRGQAKALVKYALVYVVTKVVKIVKSSRVFDM